MTEPTNDLEALAARVEYILDPTASASERLCRLPHLTNHDLRTILTALRSIAAPKQDADICPHCDGSGVADTMCGLCNGGVVEPVAWMYSHPKHPVQFDDEPLSDIAKSNGWTETPLYAHTPAKPDAPAEPPLTRAQVHDALDLVEPTGDAVDDLLETFVEAGFATVSRNPSDYESTTAWRHAIKLAYQAGSRPASITASKEDKTTPMPTDLVLVGLVDAFQMQAADDAQAIEVLQARIAELEHQIHK